MPFHSAGKLLSYHWEWIGVANILASETMHMHIEPKLLSAFSANIYIFFSFCHIYRNFHKSEQPSTFVHRIKSARDHCQAAKYEQKIFLLLLSLSMPLYFSYFQQWFLWFFFFFLTFHILCYAYYCCCTLHSVVVATVIASLIRYVLWWCCCCRLVSDYSFVVYKFFFMQWKNKHEIRK